MTFRCRAVWTGYPTEANIRAWTPVLDRDSAHVVAEGLA
ncbi:ORF 37 [Haloarcula hispanica virus SH1]|uniref:ORF 37 n=1 Tax=Haloarcula hispanica SH1 virus TaxID=326574 RepID=Q4KPF0_9VIRU|nr:ORF 37 [Haloarcula hispanica virus SH1]AAY24963.1 ORF 37 [Haloarcula hispanica virus SH1]